MAPKKKGKSKKKSPPAKKAIKKAPRKSTSKAAKKSASRPTKSAKKKSDEEVIERVPELIFEEGEPCICKKFPDGWWCMKKKNGKFFPCHGPYGSKGVCEKQKCGD